MLLRLQKLFKKSVPLPILILVLTIFLIVFIPIRRRLSDLTPLYVINGLYQSERFGERTLYNAQFYGNQFYIEKNVQGQSEMILEGTFHLVANSKNTYLLEDSSQDTGTLVVLEHDGFYFYDESRSQVVYFQLIVPLAAEKENG